MPQEAGERFRVGEEPKLAGEPELALGEGALQSRDELASKDATEHLDRKKESIPRADPVCVIERESASGNDAVDMRMVLQLLIPGMEHTEEADLRTEMAGLRATSISVAALVRNSRS